MVQFMHYNVLKVVYFNQLLIERHCPFLGSATCTYPGSFDATSAPIPATTGMVISKSIPPTFLGRKKTTSQSRNKKKLRVIKNFLLCLYCEEVSEKAIVSMTLPEQQQHASSHSPYISRIVQGGSGFNDAGHYPFRPGSPNFAALFSNGVTRYAHSMVFFILIEGPR